MIILGIETSCDETAVAIVKNGKDIKANLIYSQIKLHEKYGGVVPEISSRAHFQVLPLLLKEAIQNTDYQYIDFDAIAVTYGPGLIGSLLIGVSCAKAIAFSYKIPLIPVNHLHGHIYSVFLKNESVTFPAVALIVSGGHTELVYVKGHNEFQKLGGTLDDAAGEAFDKVGKILGLEYPAGSKIDKLAKNGNPNTIQFPRAYLGTNNFDFSFSGLKTAASRFLKQYKQVDIKDFCASFQQAIIDVLLNKTINAAIKMNTKNIIVCGGVAANSALRETFKKKAEELNLAVYLPEPEFCTDNAAMIATAAYYQIQYRQTPAFLNLNANAMLSVEQF